MLEHEKYYHIYNRTNGQVALFKNEADYLRFLRLMQRYIPPVADLLAWALMGNHFHFVVRIKEERIYRYSPGDFKGHLSSNADTPRLSSNADRSRPSGDAVRFEDVKWETQPKAEIRKRSASCGSDRVSDSEPDRPSATPIPQRKTANPTKHFSHLFNAYTSYFNLKHDRTGNLFQRAFKKNPIDSENHLRQAIIYTHQNPIKHGFVSSTQEYPWTSYHEYTDPETKSETINLTLHNLFGDVENFVALHRTISDFDEFEMQ